jgi:hypothetical protein
MKDRLIDLFGDGEPIDIEIGPNGELPPGFEYAPPANGFREFLAQNGKDRPAADSEPAAWVAWYLDSHWENNVEVYDVSAGPVEDEWPD